MTAFVNETTVPEVVLQIKENTVDVDTLGIVVVEISVEILLLPTQEGFAGVDDATQEL